MNNDQITQKHIDYLQGFIKAWDKAEEDNDHEGLKALSKMHEEWCTQNGYKPQCALELLYDLQNL